MPVLAAPTHHGTTIPPLTWKSRLASTMLLVLSLTLVVGGLAATGMLPLGWLLGDAEAGTVRQAEKLKVDLVAPGTLLVPKEVREALGIEKGKKERIAVAQRPSASPPLVLPGSTALDPTRLLRIRARFAPAEVVKVGQVNEREPGKTATVERELRSGDRVSQGTVLGVFYSIDVGNKKNDLYDALIQLKLDEEILERAEAGRGSVPEVFILNARRNVLGDRNAITRAENTLRTWNIPREEIEAIHKEAEQASREESKGTKKKDKAQEKKAKEEQLARWARVELKAPFDGTIIERNVALHEVVVDGTTNLFVLARVDRIAVIANAPEDDLPILQSLTPDQRKWAIRTVGAPNDKPLVGPIDEIGYLIDPNQHTAVVKGYIDNPQGRLRAGQFVSVTIDDLPPPPDVVEIDMNAIVDDGKQCVVFVQPNPAVPRYTLRRVLVTHRFDKTAFVRSKLTDAQRKLNSEEREQGLRAPEPLRVDERVLTAGVLELKKELEDKESAQAEKK
jgi:cobalt-zinc-cadmium efflux system membrane fusion protein